jgi:hypothetical protein
MVTRVTRLVALLGILLGAGMLRAAPAPAEQPTKPTEEEVKKGLELVNARLEKLNGQGAMVKTIDEDAVARALPGFLCFAVVFRQYPVARPIPEPLKGGNVFAVKDGKLDVVSDAKALEKFLQGGLKPAKDEAQARDAARAWLRLSEELHQDGFFQFTIPDKELAAEKAKEGWKASGKAVVEPKGGDKGQIEVTLVFDADGKLAKAEEKADLKAGVRPICQATKLLDPDPVVRGMAEKDILVMGRRAKAYLDEQRARAGPELQQAIDRVWQRILDEGW